jgi:ATP-dependent Clp protease ATP-binding subunit ClpC
LFSIDKIIDIELEKLLKRISELGYTLKLSKKAKSFIAEKGFDKQYGARPLKRAIQKYVEDALAEEIIQSNAHEGDTITLDIGKDDTKLDIKIISPKETKES